MRLHEKALQVRHRDDLASFLDDLRANLRQHRTEWENATLEDYLEAAAAWVRDMDGYFEGQGRELPQDPDWSLIAQLFLAAKMYE